MLITFASVFIPIFFFTYASKIERDVVVSQVNYIVDDILGDISRIAPQDKKQLLKSVANEIEAPILEDADRKVKQNNDELIHTASIILSVVFVAGMLISYIISRYYEHDYKSIFYENLILLAGIAVVEFVFATFIATKYISGDPNYVRRSVLRSLKEVSKQ